MYRVIRISLSLPSHFLSSLSGGMGPYNSAIPLVVPIRADSDQCTLSSLAFATLTSCGCAVSPQRSCIPIPSPLDLIGPTAQLLHSEAASPSCLVCSSRSRKPQQKGECTLKLVCFSSEGKNAGVEILLRGKAQCPKRQEQGHNTCPLPPSREVFALPTSSVHDQHR